MNRNILILALILIFYPAFANGEFKNHDGNDLIVRCKALIAVVDKHDKVDFEDMANANFCLGIIRGVLYMHQIDTVTLKSQKLFCVPKEVIVGQLARVVVKFLKDNPAILHEPETVLIVKALKNAFPCKAN